MASPLPPSPDGSPYQMMRPCPSCDEEPQVLISPWMQAPERERKTLDMAMAERRTEEIATLSRRILSRLSARLGRKPTDDEALQAILDALPEVAVYRPDTPSDWDYYQFASWTLRPRRGNAISPWTGKPKGAGDCEDLTILFCALALAAGLRARPKWLDQKGKLQNHFAVTTCDEAGTVCRWIEATLPGARVGEHPYAALRRLGGAALVLGASR
ncbi:MAG: hypothetical protein JNK72_24660 [Myxococcales bacterium]|nr:hypothetical protein [Myxococcales bacterium]